MTIINITQPEDRDAVEEREEVLSRCADLASDVDRLNAQAAQFTTMATSFAAERDEVAARIRRGLVRLKPSLDGTLPAQITDVAIERDGGDVIVALHFNASAATFRAQ